jgi:hypothetical protein
MTVSLVYNKRSHNAEILVYHAKLNSIVFQNLKGLTLYHKNVPEFQLHS